MPDLFQGAAQILIALAASMPDLFQGAAQITTLIALTALIAGLAFWLMHSTFPRFKFGTLTPLQSTIVICLLLGGIFMVIMYGIHEASRGATPAKTADVSSENSAAQLTVADGWTVRDVIQTVAAFSGRSAQIANSCSEAMLNADVKPGPISGKTRIAILENVPLHLQSTLQPFALRVVDNPSRGRYEIQCI